MEGALKKMEIRAYTTPDREDPPAKTFTVMFNPTTYTKKYAIDYYDRQGQGDSKSQQVFSKAPPQEYNFEFVIDGTGTAGPKVSVKESVEDFLDVAYNYHGEIHRPMYLKLWWGGELSKCVLKSAEVTYNLFEPSGAPLRAKINATFAEQMDDTERTRRERDNSPDLTHRRVVQEGDHLTLLTQQIYGDPSYYLQVAEANELTNYRNLEVGQELIFPPLKDVRS